eukprot:GFUD01020097.1.p1 GENE.GFUD01020097.1~~GFUD01020097.1.p1  ORF type:complete len:474 (-),score=113.66 GFUD01020097.1:54-1475(-)
MLLENKSLDLVPLVGSFYGGKSSVNMYTKGNLQLSVKKSLLVLFSPLVRDALASVGCCKPVSISIPEVSLAAIKSLMEMLEYGYSHTNKFSSEKIEEILTAAIVMEIDLKDLKIEESDGFDDGNRKKTNPSKSDEIEKLMVMDKSKIKEEYSEVTVKEEPSEELLITVEANKGRGENDPGQDHDPPNKRARIEVTPTPTTNFPEPTMASHQPPPQPTQSINPFYGSSPQPGSSNSQSPYQFGSSGHNMQFGSQVPMQGTQSMQRMVSIQSSSNGSPSMVPIQFVSNPNYFQPQSPNVSPNYPMQQTSLHQTQPGNQTGPVIGAKGQPLGNMLGQMGPRGPQTLVQQVPCTGACCPQPPQEQRTNMNQFQTKTNQGSNFYNQPSYQGTNNSYQPRFSQNQYKKNLKVKSAPWNLMTLEEKQSITCPDWNRGNCTREGDDYFCYFMGRKLRHCCSRLVDKDRICWGKHKEPFHHD